ncbi:hypothetical protein [Pasteuria penetrans]|uniref:hypothetical protein n=1 Tax=Pasteuria penetrans TaxID=86005 RepID=UPI0011ECEE25|nr:hypothetical protein [Pasteuria penetrans]
MKCAAQHAIRPVLGTVLDVMLRSLVGDFARGLLCPLVSLGSVYGGFFVLWIRLVVHSYVVLFRYVLLKKLENDSRVIFWGLGGGDRAGGALWLFFLAMYYQGVERIRIISATAFRDLS